MMISADWLVLPGGKLEKGPVYVAIEGERIAAVNRQSSPPTTDPCTVHAHLLTAGFVDLHTHGLGVWRTPSC